MLKILLFRYLDHYHLRWICIWLCLNLPSFSLFSRCHICLCYFSSFSFLWSHFIFVVGLLVITLCYVTSVVALEFIICIFDLPVSLQVRVFTSCVAYNTNFHFSASWPCVIHSFCCYIWYNPTLHCYYFFKQLTIFYIGLNNKNKIHYINLCSYYLRHSLFLCGGSSVYLKSFFFSLKDCFYIFACIIIWWHSLLSTDNFFPILNQYISYYSNPFPIRYNVSSLAVKGQHYS